MKKILLSVIIFGFSIIAQERFTFHSGTAFILENKNSYRAEYLGDYWSNPINFGISVDFEIGKNIYLSPGLSYSTLAFDNYFEKDILIPEYYLISSSGERSDIYKLSLNVIYRAVRTKVPNISIMAGINFVNEYPGRIILNIGNILGYDNINVVRSEKNKFYVTFNFGLGIDLIKINQFVFSLQPSVQSDFNDVTDVNLNAGISYILE